VRLQITESSANTPQISTQMAAFLELVSEAYLREVVRKIAIPRHWFREYAANRFVGDWIAREFASFGLQTFRQGEYDNVIASTCNDFSAVRVLVGAHFDSVPASPGADDNASAVAAMLAVAKAISRCPGTPVGFVAFNREEDGMLGSTDFVENFLSGRNHCIELVHVLEMVGFSSSEPGSQRVPPGLPIKLRDRGDFIGVIANSGSNKHIDGIRELAQQIVPQLPLASLKVVLGIERFFPVLLRSDHSSFWAASIPALMWTDTAEFRNPNYHQPTDLPDTLDWRFLADVTRLLVADVVQRLSVGNR